MTPAGLLLGPLRPPTGQDCLRLQVAEVRAKLKSLNSDDPLRAIWKPPPLNAGAKLLGGPGEKSPAPIWRTRSSRSCSMSCEGARAGRELSR